MYVFIQAKDLQVGELYEDYRRIRLILFMTSLEDQHYDVSYIAVDPQGQVRVYRRLFDADEEMIWTHVSA